MRIRGTILALALVLPGIAAAATAARMGEGVCAASWAAFVDLADLPDATMEGSKPATRAALSALAADMPNPAGRFQIHIAAPEGFGAARFAGFALTGLPRTLAEAMPIFDGVTVDASYQRSTGAPK